jgi:hypothetical protein
LCCFAEKQKSLSPLAFKAKEFWREEHAFGASVYLLKNINFAAP